MRRPARSHRLCLYATKHNISYSATTRHEITIKDIGAIAKEQKVTFKPADNPDHQIRLGEMV